MNKTKKIKLYKWLNGVHINGSLLITYYYENTIVFSSLNGEKIEITVVLN